MSTPDIDNSVPHVVPKISEDPYAFEPPLLVDWMAEAKNLPKWLIEGFLPTDSLVLISGPAKRAKKSYFAFNLALCVASGHKVGQFESASKLPENVLILEGEGSKREAYQRIIRVCNGAMLNHEPLPIWFSHRLNMVLDKPEWAERVADFVKKYQVKLVIVDTLRIYMKGDENSSEAFSEMSRSFNRIREAGASIIFIHHVSKPGAVEKDPDDEIRGSSGIAGVYDVHFAIRTKAGRKFENLTIRSKDDGDHHFEVSWEFGGKDADEFTKLDMVAITEEKRLERLCTEIMMEISAHDDKPVRPSTLRKTIDAPEGAVDEALDFLVGNRTIYKGPRGYQISKGGLDPVEGY